MVNLHLPQIIVFFFSIKFLVLWTLFNTFKAFRENVKVH